MVLPIDEHWIVMPLPFSGPGAPLAVTPYA
jgi:hypothetical protein